MGIAYLLICVKSQRQISDLYFIVQNQVLSLRAADLDLWRLTINPGWECLVLHNS